jgi:RNA polymerase sigma factor (sigma-70 family)
MLEPLTKAGCKRLPRVDAEIAGANGLKSDDLIGAARIRDEAASGYISAEAIVFFIRRASRRGDRAVLNALFEELYQRCQPFFRGKIRGFADDWRQDVQQAVLRKLAEDILADDDRGDFAQQLFWKYLERKTIDACRKAERDRDRSVSTDADADREEVADESENGTPAATPEDIASNREAIRGLEGLPPRLRKVLVMRHYYGLKIGSDDWTADDPSDPTLARYFEVSGRTIRSWLKEAAKMLADFQEK